MSIPKTSRQPEMAYELIRFVLTNPDLLPITGKMGSMFVGHVDYWEYAMPPEGAVDQEAFKHTFFDLGQRDGTHPVYHPKFQEWENTVYRPSFDPLWIGEERDAAVACAQAHEGTIEILQSL
jgi:hypothetical protein